MKYRSFNPIVVVFVIFLSFSSLLVIGQSTQFQWAKTYGGGNNYAPPVSLRSAANKELIVSGSFSGTVDFALAPDIEWWYRYLYS